MVTKLTAVSEKLLEVRDYNEAGYRPVVDFRSWRVAILNHTDELRVENLASMQRHDETDEVFVLLKGRCILFLGEGTTEITDVVAADMQPFKLYNVKMGAWHTHALSLDAMVLIVENRDTTYANSPFYKLGEAHRRKIAAITAELWGNTVEA